MKKILMTIVLCLSLCLAGCGGKASNEAKPADNKKVEEQTSKTNDKKQDEETADTQDTEGVTPNDTKVYPGSEDVTEVKMGVCENGEGKTLCTIKLPNDYFTSLEYMDKTGETQSNQEEQGDPFSEIVKTNSMQEYPWGINLAFLAAPNEVDNSYTIAIVDGETTIDAAKEHAPDGIDIATGGEHNAYVYYSPSEMYDVVVVYSINKDWTLLIQNKGELKDEMSLEEIGQEFYDLITPVE